MDQRGLGITGPGAGKLEDTLLSNDQAGFPPDII
jgi:hypothetical protein